MQFDYDYHNGPVCRRALLSIFIDVIKNNSKQGVVLFSGYSNKALRCEKYLNDNLILISSRGLASLSKENILEEININSFSVKIYSIDTKNLAFSKSNTYHNILTCLFVQLVSEIKYMVVKLWNHLGSRFYENTPLVSFDYVKNTFSKIHADILHIEYLSNHVECAKNLTINRISKIIHSLIKLAGARSIIKNDLMCWHYEWSMISKLFLQEENCDF